MFDLVTILSGTALVCMLLGFLWSRYERKPTPRDWVPTKSPCINHNSGIGYCYKDCPVCGDDDQS